MTTDPKPLTRDEERKRMARDEARRLADGVYGARVVHVRFYEVRR